MDGCGWGNWGGWMGMMMLPAFLTGLLVLTLVVAGVVLVARWAAREKGGGVGKGETGHHEALRIAEMRYARGEITREDLEEIRRTLHGMD